MSSNPALSIINAKLSEVILRALLYENAKDGAIDRRGKVYFGNLRDHLDFNNNELKVLKREIASHLKPDNTLGSLCLESFFRDIHEKIDEKELPLSERMSFYKNLRSLLRCEGELNEEFLTSLATQECARRVELQLKKEMDPECYELLESVCQMDWDEELVLFRERLIYDKVVEEVEREGYPKPGPWQPIAYSGLGGLAATLTAIISYNVLPQIVMLFGYFAFPMILAILSRKWVVYESHLTGQTTHAQVAAGYGLICGIALMIGVPMGQVAALGGFLMALGGTVLGAWYGLSRREDAIEEKREERISLRRRDFDGYILSPFDLMTFWESQVMGYLRSLKGRCSLKLSQAARKRATSRKTIQEMSELPDPDLDMIQRLEDNLIKLDDFVEDATSVNQVIQRLEDEYKLKIEELRELVLLQKKLENAEYRKGQLARRASRILDETDEMVDRWEVQKQELDLKMNAMLISFKEQLTHTRDFVEAEIGMQQISAIEYQASKKGSIDQIQDKKPEQLSLKKDS